MAECLQLTETDLATLIGEGWTQVSGPYTTQAECLDACDSFPPCPYCDPITPAIINLTASSGGSGDLAFLNGLEIQCAATAMCTWTSVVTNLNEDWNVVVSRLNGTTGRIQIQKVTDPDKFVTYDFDWDSCCDPVTATDQTVGPGISGGGPTSIDVSPDCG